jgi:hypothetical protein
MYEESIYAKKTYMTAERMYGGKKEVYACSLPESQYVSMHVVPIQYSDAHPSHA